MDNLQIANALIDAVLPRLNEALPKAIRAGGLDPWKEVASDKKVLGKVNLGICTAKAEASYAITDLKGLSSIELLSAQVETISVSGAGKARGTLTISARLTKRLSARARGTVRGECGSLSESATIKGTVAAEGVAATFSGSFRATLGRESCVTSLAIGESTWKYSDIDISIDGLGVFNSVLDDLVDAVTKLMGKALRDPVADALDGELNGVLEGVLPLCIGTTEVSGVGQAAGAGK